MFGALIPGRPLQTNIQTLSPTHFLFLLPSSPPPTSLVVFLLPSTILPPATAAAIYIQPPRAQAFTLLGALHPSAPSALLTLPTPSDENENDTESMVLDDSPLTLGIAFEDAAALAPQLAALQPCLPASSVAAAAAAGVGSGAVVARPVGTKVLAQRIIRNAFNFLGSFAGGAAGRETVPLRAFREWWLKFEKRLELDPAFLERDEEG
ncbi:MAG: hypothetical protein M1829_004880 [Trizodia sp. TS-e1964]|nr:MAG: hypothetical protein M1829_004880 [Trizodia sp. TS-e1964]